MASFVQYTGSGTLVAELNNSLRAFDRASLEKISRVASIYMSFSANLFHLFGAAAQIPFYYKTMIMSSLNDATQSLKNIPSLPPLYLAYLNLLQQAIFHIVTSENGTVEQFAAYELLIYDAMLLLDRFANENLLLLSPPHTTFASFDPMKLTKAEMFSICTAFEDMMWRSFGQPKSCELSVEMDID